jgi:hypothetical protein
MKVPFLKVKVYVLTGKQLAAKLEAARTEGRTEGRSIANAQVNKLLNDNYKLSAAGGNMAGGKKRK